MEIPKYDVVVWHKATEENTNLYEEIVAASGKKPYESTEMEEFRDIHWGFSNSSDALAFADSLLEIAANENVLKLTVIGNELGRKVYKDTLSRNQ